MPLQMLAPEQLDLQRRLRCAKRIRPQNWLNGKALRNYFSGARISGSKSRILRLSAHLTSKLSFPAKSPAALHAAIVKSRN